MPASTPPLPLVPVGPSTVVAIVTAAGAAAGAVAAALEERTPEAITAAAIALGAVVTLVASRTSQANAIAAAAAPTALEAGEVLVAGGTVSTTISRSVWPDTGDTGGDADPDLDAIDPTAPAVSEGGDSE